MGTRNVLKVVIAAGITCSLLAGCATFSGKPKWAKGTGAFSQKERKKTLYGVGIAENISSTPLRRSTADDRAIAEIAKQISALSTSLLRDYMNSGQSTAQEKDAGSQYVESTIKTFSSTMVNGVRIVDRWDNGTTAYSLATLSVDDVKNCIAQLAQLSDSVRGYLSTNVERGFEQLDQK